LIMIREFGQVIVWFDWRFLKWIQNWIGSRNCSRNVSSSQTQYCSSWPCIEKYFTDKEWNS
jgi:hypothetical protein